VRGGHGHDKADSSRETERGAGAGRRQAEADDRPLPKPTRRALGQQAAKGRARRGRPGRALEDRNREQIYGIARQKRIPGRSKMGKWELIEAIRRAG
jgi:hypothetical protein